MLFSQLALYEQLILSFAAIALLLSFFMLAHPRMASVVKLFALQGLFVSTTTAFVAYASGESHLYISALLSFVLKFLFIPYLLLRMIDKFDLHFEIDTVTHPALLLLGAGILVVFCYHITLPIAHFALTNTGNIIGLSMAIVLIGMLILISRRKAITQVVGFMSVENGLFFAAVAITQGMPMIVELGIAFDVLIAAVIFGLFFLHLDESIETLDISKLNQLSESE